MKLALFSDLHANRQATEAVWAHARRAGFDQAVFLGDYVDYGADPDWTLDFLMAQVEAGALALQGNHDQAMARGPSPHMGADVQNAVRWSATQLSPAQQHFLANLPLTLSVHGCFMAHANAHAPQGWGYLHGSDDARRSLMAAPAPVVFCGHVHEPALYHLDLRRRVGAFTPVPDVPIGLSIRRRWLAVPGSVGQPRDGNPAAAWALFDTQQQQLTFHRTPYDHGEAARRIVAAGLPTSHAERLQHGH